MPGVSAPNNTEPKGPKHLNMIEMAAPSITINLLSLSDKELINIEAKDLDFTIFINKIYHHKYTHFDGARDRLK